MNGVIFMKISASIANLGPGFDIIAAAIDGFYDYMTVKIERGYGNIEVISEGYNVPSGVMNTAYASVKALLSDIGEDDINVYVSIKKGIPPSMGLGSSGASAVGSVYGVIKLLGKEIEVLKLLKYAGEGEALVAEAPHYDNVSASLMGGIVCVDPSLRWVYRIPNTPLLYVTLILPDIKIKNKTRYSRKILPYEVPSSVMIKQTSSAMTLLYALLTKNLKLLGKAISSDYYAEPIRSKMIPFYEEVKCKALSLGALGFNICGAGPGMFSISSSYEVAEKIGAALTEIIRDHGYESRYVVTKIRRHGIEIWRNIKEKSLFSY